MIKTRLEWALWMAAKGITIFIVEPNSKNPLGGHSWMSRCSTDPDQITAWFEQTENANYGCWMGDDYAVIDLDVKPNVNGVAIFEELCAENGLTSWDYGANTFTVRTPSGGYHLYFKVDTPIANANKFPKGIDVRAAVGYVVGPGCSVIKEDFSEGTYEILNPDVDIAECPEWVMSEYLREKNFKDPRRHEPLCELDLPENIAQALKWLHHTEVATKGAEGDQRTYDLCCQMRDFGLSEEQMLITLNDETRGESWNQRCDPPWEDGELSIKIRNSMRYAANRPGCEAASYRMDLLKQARPAGGYGLTAEKVNEMTNPKSKIDQIVDNSLADRRERKKQEDGASSDEIPDDVADDKDDGPDAQDDAPQFWWGVRDFAARENIREYVIKDWLIAHGVTALLAKRGTGKGLPLNEPVLTPWGWKPIKDLKVGDRVCSPEGGKTEVTGVYPQGIRPCYEFTFEDGSIARCDDQHLWALRTRRPGRSSGTVKDVVWPMKRVLEEFHTNNHKMSVPTIGRTSRMGCPVRPNMCAYTLGLLLGDGTFMWRDVEFTTIDDQLRDHMLDMGFTVKKPREGKEHITVMRLPHPRGEENKVYESFKSMKLFGKGSHVRFIPEMFFNASYETRLALLQGLMDTDGTVNGTENRDAGRSGSGAVYTSTSEELAKGVQKLAWSLGARASINKYPSYLNGERKRDHYDVYVQTGNKFKPFRLQRKLDILTPYMHKKLWRRIADIKEISPQETVCISVDNPNGLFVTRDYVVTHNSTVALDLAMHLAHDMDWWDTPTMKNWKVIYICGEDDEGMILNVRAWAKYNNRGLPPNDRFKISSNIIKMTSRTELEFRMEEMVKWADGARCVIILDTWARATSGFSANTQEEMDSAYENAEKMAKALQGPMIACFHPPKEGKLTIRGSAVQEDASSGIWTLTDEGTSRRLRITRAKGKGHGRYRDFTFKQVNLEGKDFYDDDLQGIVAIKEGGTEDEGSKTTKQKLDAARTAWALLVVACEEFPMMSSYDEPKNLRAENVGKFICKVWRDAERGVVEAETFKTKYLQRGIDLGYAGFFDTEKSVQTQLRNYFFSEGSVTKVEFEGQWTVEVFGKEFVVTRAPEIVI